MTTFAVIGFILVTVTIVLAIRLIISTKENKEESLSRLEAEEQPVANTVTIPLVNGLHGTSLSMKNSFDVKDGKTATVKISCATECADIHVSKDQKEWDYLGTLATIEDTVSLKIKPEQVVYLVARKKDWIDSEKVRVTGANKKIRKRPLDA